MARFKAVNVELDGEQKAEAERIFQRIRGSFEEEARNLANLMASKDNAHLLGATEFELRDRVHALGAEVLEATADERVKKGRLRGS